VSPARVWRQVRAGICLRPALSTRSSAQDDSVSGRSRTKHDPVQLATMGGFVLGTERVFISTATSRTLAEWISFHRSWLDSCGKVRRKRTSAAIRHELQ